MKCHDCGRAMWARKAYSVLHERLFTACEAYWQSTRWLRRPVAAGCGAPGRGAVRPHERLALPCLHAPHDSGTGPFPERARPEESSAKSHRAGGRAATPSQTTRAAQGRSTAPHFHLGPGSLHRIGVCDASPSTCPSENVEVTATTEVRGAQASQQPAHGAADVASLLPL